MFDRTWTVVHAAGAVAEVVPLPDFSLPGGDPRLELLGWSGALLGSNAYVFEGNVGLADASDRIAASARMDCLLTIPPGGIARVEVAGDIENRLSVFFDTGALAHPQIVQIRLRQVA